MIFVSDLESFTGFGDVVCLNYKYEVNDLLCCRYDYSGYGQSSGKVRHD